MTPKIPPKILKIISSNKSKDEIVSQLNSEFQNLLSNFGNLRFSCKSKLAFKLLANLSKYKCVAKSGGGIVRRIQYMNGSIENNPEIVNKLIIQHFKTIHQNKQSTEIKTSKIRFPTLPRPSSEKAIWISSKFSNDKAVSFDGIEDSIFKIHSKCKTEPCTKCKRKVNLIQSLWDQHYWNSGKGSKSFTCRLIALNKVFPSIPHVDKYRPIIVMSPLIKILEMYNSIKLKH
jgi:hypothetical protein